MPSDIARARVLFVDDDPALRLTFSAILDQNRFEVTTVATVSEALVEIGARQFEVLISDLNIGQPGDGFTVVSAMRRTQPQCVNFILTGYPAFDAALETIRTHADNYFVKPADIRKLLEQLNESLASPRELWNFRRQTVADFIRTHAADIVNRTLLAMKTHPRLAPLRLSSDQRVDHIPGMLAEIVEQLQSDLPQTPTAGLLRSGMEHGETRKRQGYSQTMLVDDIRLVDSSTYAVIQDHLLALT